ncbi:hypothetical protein SI65_07995 [Aspergillus cristatus]|uniref:NADH:flavin oxidoreductase/NADH oxidase N-terminal domain-containing protein n=1 Tax=Aspergillus cristatus TaxID=573508 RepID=A0A1E3B6G4_ASPCR|nr:hypothetical protein SI65_07995 [Aspergillus cristatus]
MAPLTRFRADDKHVQLSMATEYYCQHASTPGTSIIAESSLISPSHGGVPNAPGMWNDEQVAGWKKVVDAVHARGCFIFCQLLAPGRAADVTTLQKEAGHGLLSSSHVPRSDAAAVPERRARLSFDGVEIHGANGYLLDQFLQDTCNCRNDEYGGSVESRARFAIEVASSISNAIGPEKLGYRISPWSSFQGMRMSHPVPQFSYLVEKLRDLKLGYLHVIESRVTNNVDIEKTEGIEFVLDIWGKCSPVLVAGGYTPENAKHAVDKDYVNNEVAVVFGRHFLANPDLPFRIQHGIPLTKYDRTSFYTPKTATGYTDYPFSFDFLAKHKN